MGYLQSLMRLKNQPGTSYTLASQMNSCESWWVPSDPSDKSSTTLKLVESARNVSSSKPEIETWDFSKIIGKKPNDIKNIKVVGSDLNTKNIIANFRMVNESHQKNISTIGGLYNIHISSVFDRIDNRNKQNYDNFRENYMGILDEVKNEAEHARSLDSDVEEIKNEAYDEFAVVMEEIYNAGVSMPEVTWNEDGSLDIGWPLKMGGTSTILVYGDDHVIYNTYLGQNNYVESICKISDGSLLPKLIGILSNITD